MNRAIYMLGGSDITGGRLSPLDRRWIADAAEGPICVVDLTSRNAAVRPKYREAMRAYFSQLTEKDLLFVSEMPSRSKIVSAFQSAGAIYIPGGDTETLLDDLVARNLAPLFHSATCPIAGNSAGAVAVCREAVLTTDDDVHAPVVRPGIGLVGFSVDPHYDLTHDKELTVLSRGRVIFGLPEESAIVATDGTTEFIGSVWQFRDGQKKKVN
jgi:peptidase E